MDVAPDLAPDVLAHTMPGRPVRVYPALVSTESDARAWARGGAPTGAVVVADHQVAARGWGGWEWEVHPGRDLGFSLVARPALSPDREGWLYVVAALGTADALGSSAGVAWPDRVADGAGGGRVGVHVDVGPAGVGWAVVSVWVWAPPAPRGTLLARTADAIEARLGSREDDVLEDYAARCGTIGTRVSAHLVPMGPAGERVEGTADSVLADGALVIRTADGARVAVRPQSVGRIDALAPG